MKHQRVVWVALFVGFMGCIPLYNVVNSPRFQAIGGIDVLRLLAAGMCFGAAITAWAGLLFFRGRRFGGGKAG